MCRLMVTNETSYDSGVLTKDTGVIRDFLIVGDQGKLRKTELTNN